MRAVTEFGLHSLMDGFGKSRLCVCAVCHRWCPNKKNVLLMLKENEMKVNEIAKKGWP